MAKKFETGPDIEALVILFCTIPLTKRSSDKKKVIQPSVIVLEREQPSQGGG